MANEAAVGGAAAGSATAGAAGAPANAGSPQSGSEGAVWHASLPPDVAAKPWVKTHKTADTFWKSMDEAQSLIGRSVQVPKTSDRAEWERVWNKLGRPEKLDGYKLKNPTLPAGTEMPKVLSEGFTQFAHDIGLSNWQAQQLIDHVGTRLASEVKGPGTLDDKAARAVLQKAWGGATERNIALAQRAVQYLGGDELRQALKETGGATHPRILIAFAKMGATLAEDNTIAGDGPVGQQAAKDELSAIMDNPKHAYWIARDPGHKDAVARVRALNEQIYGKP
jgi:hypothetical protein